MSGDGRAQWVVPKQKPAASASNKENSRNRASGSTASIFRQPYHDYSSQSHLSSTPSSIIIEKSYTPMSQSRQLMTQTESIGGNDERLNKQQIDDAICKTICVIVEQYLKELREHQKQISLARSKLVREAHHDDGTFIAHSDVSKLRVRDEQTKAIETIKQLTNYLKELSTIKRQEGDEVDSVSEAMYDRLSDLRNDIIHTLNDFVLANSDIDVPIVDLDDPTGAGRDYDLCIEAQRSNRDICEIEISQPRTDGTAAAAAANLPFKANQHQNSHNSEDGIRARHPARPDQQPVRRPLAGIDDSGNHAQTCQPLAPEARRIVESVDYDDKYKLMAIHDDYQLIEIDKRKREIHKLERDTVELRNLFADFYNLVKMQGEQVDTIEDNLVVAAQQISEGRNHLQSRPMRGLTVLVPMTGCLTGALIGGPIGFFVGGKLGGLTIICATSLLGLLSSLSAQRCIETNRTK